MSTPLAAGDDAGIPGGGADAAQKDKFALIRSFRHHNSDHGPADHYLFTGYFPQAGFNPTLKPNNQRPAHGAIIARKLGPRGSVPPYVCLPKMHPSAGSAYLGAAAAPFVIEADPNAPDFSVPDVVPPPVIETDRLEARRHLLAQVDRYQRSAEARVNRAAQAVSVFQQKAFELMTSPSSNRGGSAWKPIARRSRPNRASTPFRSASRGARA